MSAESDLLRVVLALQMGFVTKEQVVECGAVWADDRSRRLTDLLQEKGYLKPTARQGLDVMVKAKVEEYAGDPGQSLAALSMDHDIHQSILSLPLDEQVRDTLMKHDWARRAVPVEPVAPETIVVTKPREEERYRLGTELGRGGLGRVLVAEDTVLGREVAIKEMLEGVGSAQTLKRFLREGEVAGRLLHPNIVPVFDVGVREDGERKTPYFAMGKIAGRDLQVILRAVEDGEGKARHDFSRPRLLRIFQDVCLAMAYAHHHGVIHRDLKPANVMVGDFGEVYVVDWGLAKVMGEKYDPGVTVAEGDVDSAAPALTMDGQTLGTPAYMPPEQADGQIDEIDHQSDIYSLGAILYEILTFRPPFEGATGYNVIAKVLEGKLTPPSVRASEVRQAIKETRKDEGITSPESVPVELGEIVLKAMAKEKGTRYVTVMELHEEVQQYLDGEKQKEMKHEESVKNYEGARHNIEEWEQAKKDLVKIEARIKDVSERVKPFFSVAKKRVLWDLEKEREKLQTLIYALGTAAEMSFNTALSIEDDEEVRNALLEHLWVRFLEAEEEKEKHESVRLLSMVELHDRMPYLDGRKRSQIMRERIKGDGTLTITSRHYPCPCLTEGRMVSPQELAGSVECRVSGVKRKEMQDSSLNTEHSTRDTSTCGMMGYHPFSGRALDGRKGAEGLPELEPKEPIHLKVHGPGCRTEALEGADVWLFKYEEKDKILIPVFPEGIEVDGFTRQVVPDDILDRCFDKGSPYRPGAGLHLGKTSVAKFTIPMGSYLLILHKEGSHPVRCPVYIGRLTDEEVSVTLYRNGEIPEGFIQVPAGRFIFQGDKENPYSGPKEVKETEDSFIARFPVTCREYVEFLNDLALRNPKEASMRVPRKAPTAGFYWPKDEKGRYHIPTEKWMARAPEIIKKQSSKLDSTPIWWEEDWPVFSLSWEDLMAYAAWRTGREDLLFSLPHEIQWEKSARGTDGRFYPWGKEMDATFCNSNQSLEEGMCPTTVHSFPADESPYGARGHCGNCRDMVLNDPGEAYTGWRMCRGGGWSFINIDIRPSARTGDSMSSVFYNDGGRLSWLPCSKTQKA